MTDVRTVPAHGRQPELAYVDGGETSGRPVVLMHSLGTDHRMWGAVAKRLGPEYRILIPDARGHGMSGWESGSALSVDDWVADAVAVLDHANVEAAAVVGLSMGGVQALALAVDRPERVSGLVIADSFAHLARDVAAARIDGMTAQARGGMDQLARDYLAATLTTDSTHLGAVVDDLRSAIAAVPADAFIESVRACFGAELADRIGEITCKSVVLWGERDQKTPRDLSEFIAETIPGAELRTLAAAGHLSAVENPDAFSDAVSELLRASLRRNEVEQN